MKFFRTLYYKLDMLFNWMSRSSAISMSPSVLELHQILDLTCILDKIQRISRGTDSGDGQSV